MNVPLYLYIHHLGLMHSNQCPLSSHTNMTLQTKLLALILLSFCTGLGGKLKVRIMYCDRSVALQNGRQYEEEEDIVFLSLR